MLNLIELRKPCTVNGEYFDNPQEAFKRLEHFDGTVEIIINPRRQAPPVVTPEPSPQPERQVAPDKQYRISVRQYMTKPSSPDFDFQRKYNNDKPMPMRTMVWEILQETKGMYKMKLHAKPTPTDVCMVCGRTLTHPVSLLYGIGPECGGHFHISPFATKAELDASYQALKQRLADVVWEGWVIKSAITSMKEEKEG